jgi:hypothetical protein
MVNRRVSGRTRTCDILVRSQPYIVHLDRR